MKQTIRGAASVLSPADQALATAAHPRARRRLPGARRRQQPARPGQPPARLHLPGPRQLRGPSARRRRTRCVSQHLLHDVLHDTDILGYRRNELVAGEGDEGV